MRLINADELKNILSKPPSYWGMELHMAEILNIIDEQPTVDLKHGVWEVSIIEADSEFTENFEITHCSECGYHNIEKGVKSPYCPRCGARMDGKAIKK